MTNNKNKITNSIILFLSIIFLIIGYNLIIESVGNKKYNLKDYIITEELKPAFDNNNIPVAFASDNNYVKYLSVAIVSLTDNMSKDYNYDIVILEDNIKDKNKRLLLKQIKDFKNVSLRFIDINRYFDKNKDVEFYLVDGAKYLTRSMYNRFFIPDIFKNYDKVIYLDCDILINSDLVDLYKINLGDNMIGGVTINENYLASNPNLTNEVKNDTKKFFNIENYSSSFYINSGVILYDIVNCNNYNFVEKCLEFIKLNKDAFSPDQDAINVVCYKKIYYLDYRYNFLAYLYTDLPETRKYILDDAKIIHFAVHHPLNKALYSHSIGKWIETSFKSPFFKNKKKYLPITIYKLELTLLRYKICYKIYRSEKRLKKYKEKIENLEKRVKFIEGIDK